MAKNVVVLACMSMLAAIPCSAATITVNNAFTALMLTSLPPGVYFYEDFPTTVIDPNNWTNTIGEPTIDGVGIGEPSPPYSLRLNGLGGIRDMCESRVIDLEGLSNVGLIYWYERRGGGESPDPGDDLVIDYWNGSNWIELDRQPGDGPDMTEFVESIISLPMEAMHSEFRLRARSMGGWDYIDEWFLDDILLTDNPIIEMSSSEFVFNADANGLNPDDQILAIQNRGGDILNWEISETCDWLTPIPAAGSLEPNAITEVGLSVDISGLWWGNYNCQLTFSDPCAANSPKYVGVELYVREVSGILPVPSLYPTIRTAVDNSDNGDTVLVADGIYTGEGNRNIDFLGKAITVKSANGPENCIIDREYVSRAFYFNNGETSSSKIEGITILNGNQNFGSSIYINNSSPTISNCHFKDNSRFNGEGVIYCEGSSSEITNCIFDNNYMENGSGIVCKNNGNIIIKGCEFYRGGDSAIICEYGVVATIDNCIIMYTNGTADHHAPPAIWLVEAYGSINNCLIAKNNSTRWAAGIGCTRSSPSITNCTIVDNESLEDGGGIFCYDSYPVIKNCIIWNNEPPSGSQVVLVAGSDPIITHSNVQGSWAGIGNIDIDPNFVDPDNGDYHLMSQAGHWDESTESWIQDDVTSPCVDAGDPNSDYSSEPWPNGGRINMGAYGNTPEASRSCTNIDDVRLMGADWLQDDSVTDIMPFPDGDGIVDLRDYAFLFEHWLCQGN